MSCAYAPNIPLRSGADPGAAFSGRMIDAALYAAAARHSGCACLVRRRSDKGECEGG
jgi:hypothetical protein